MVKKVNQPDLIMEFFKQNPNKDIKHPFATCTKRAICKKSQKAFIATIQTMLF